MNNYLVVDAQGFLVGFYHADVHGPRRLLMPDPAWVRPLITVTLQPGQSVQALDADGNPVTIANDTDQPMLVDRVPDQSAVAPLIDGGPNPDTKIPPEAVEITEAQYRELLEHQGQRKVSVGADGSVSVALYTPPPPPLDQVQAAALTRIDHAAGQARARYITVAPGQEGTYQVKAEQAEAYRAAGYPADATPYPLIDLEAQATGQTPRATADLVLATREQWLLLAARIEAARLGGKRNVNAATTVAAVETARDAALMALERI